VKVTEPSINPDLNFEFILCNSSTPWIFLCFTSVLCIHEVRSDVISYLQLSLSQFQLFLTHWALQALFTESFTPCHVICHTTQHGLSTWTQPQVVELRVAEMKRTCRSVWFTMRRRASDTRCIGPLVPFVTSAWMGMSLKYYRMSRHEHSWYFAQSAVTWLSVTSVYMVKVMWAYLIVETITDINIK
jgi:hypothetical protein